MTKMMHVLTCVLLVILLGACGGGESAPTNESGGEDTNAAAPDDAETESETETETGAETADFGEPTTSCEDEPGDVDTFVTGKDVFAETKEYKGSPPEHADLLGVDVVADDESLAVRYELAAPPPEGDDPKSFPHAGVRFSLYVDGMYTYSISGWMDDSAPAAMERKKTKNGISTEPIESEGGTITLQGSELVLTVPRDAFPKAQDGFSWSALTSATTKEDASKPGVAAGSDTCPKLTDQELGELSSTFSKPSKKLLDKLPEES